MAISFNPLTVLSGFNLASINTNFQTIKTALTDGLSRSGGTPNQMNTDIDMNNNDLLNVDIANIKNLKLNGQTVALTSLSTLPPDVLLKSAAAPDGDNTRNFGTSTLRWLKGWFQNISLFPPASVTPTINGEVTFQLTSDTSLTFRVRGSDGVVRSGSITLA